MTIKTERLLSKAKKLYTKGNFAESESIYLEVLKLAPNNKDAKNAIFALVNSFLALDKSLSVLIVIINVSF